MADIRYEDHTDGVAHKLRQLQAVLATGKLDLALSLTESLKSTLEFDRQLQSPSAAADLASDAFQATSELPAPWAAWAEGWSYCKPMQLFETVGIERIGELVDISTAFHVEQIDDPFREVRVARVDTASATLVEVPSQVYDQTRSGDEVRVRVVFPAAVPAHEQAAYLLFFGNPNAERPHYVTDLRASGEGYGLDIENHHFRARLSRQMGQLERLISKRQHGLELYAGGKGHGEPPNIDWAHDYVDEGHFQKLRARNWSRCPNFEVIRGPLCVRVRRWGFPHSPIHPVFTPSRIHIDQTYVFLAGMPYFLKDGRMDAVQKVNIAAMRDDEWVFSGYSFTDTLWIDAQGRLHEGSVPTSHAQNLWGVGFYNRQSRDAFVALWLEHTSEKFAGLQHGGAPTLHYDGHGQLWSRYPAEQTTLPAGASIRQRNAYLFAEFPQQQPEAIVERLRHQLLNPLEVRAGVVPPAMRPAAHGSLARYGETAKTAKLKPAIWNALREVRDEQLYTIDANVVDLGYVYDVRERHGTVHVLVTMPHRGRPVFEFLVTAGGGRVEPGIRERLLQIHGVRDVVVELCWDPPWTVARLSDAARTALGLADSA